MKKVDGRKNNGGNKNAGRKSKAAEQKLIEQLDGVIDSKEVIKELNKLVNKGDFRAIQLYFQYRWGKAKEQIDVTTNGESLKPNQITFIKSDED